MTTQDKVQVLNYATHALEQLEADCLVIRKDMPGIRAAHEAVIRLLRQSVKFLLPNRAELIDMGELKQVHVDMARLPYPVVALEATWFLPDGEGGDKGGGLRCSRRIALCMTLSPEIVDDLPDTAHFLQEEQGGVLVIPLFWDDAAARWTLPMGGVFVPYQNEVSDYVAGEANAIRRMVTEPFIDAGLPLRQLKQFRVLPFVVLPEMFNHAMKHRSCEQLAVSILMDSRDEVAMLMQTGVVLNCANVSVGELAAPAFLNKKRTAKGKQPFFSYRVLQVKEPRDNSSSTAGRSHGPLRGHLRRGHIRRLEGRTVWVRPSVVNPNAPQGRLHKDYAIRPLKPDA